MNEKPDRKPSPGEDQIREIFRSFGLVAQLGLTMIGTVLFGLAAGFALDRAIGTGKVFKLIGILLGVGAGSWVSIRLVMDRLER